MEISKKCDLGPDRINKVKHKLSSEQKYHRLYNPVGTDLMTSLPAPSIDCVTLGGRRRGAVS